MGSIFSEEPGHGGSDVVGDVVVRRLNTSSVLRQGDRRRVDHSVARLKTPVETCPPLVLPVIPEDARNRRTAVELKSCNTDEIRKAVIQHTIGMHAGVSDVHLAAIRDTGIHRRQVQLKPAASELDQVGSLISLSQLHCCLIVSSAVCRTPVGTLIKETVDL